jgi:pyrimidine operon attenuation protein/uracil phosphoribosyltransferase
MSRLILTNQQVEITIERLCHQLIENHGDFSNTCIIGLQTKGVYLSKRIAQTLKKINSKKEIKHGSLDITFFRDDYRRRDSLAVPSQTHIDFIVEDKNVVLIDDVLYTGRTIRAALDALLAFGRPRKVELLVLIDRKFSRQLPIEPDYTGKAIDTIDSENVKVQWSDAGNVEGVWLVTKQNKNGKTAKR